MGGHNTTACCIVAAVLGAPAVASASGFDVPRVGSLASGPVTVDAAAVHHNPGQLGYLRRGAFSFGAGLIVGRVGYTRQRRGTYQYADNFDLAEPVPLADLDPSKTGDAAPVAAHPLGPTVDLFVAVPVIPERLTLGAGVYVPYAALLDLPEDGPQRFALQSITLISAHATLSAAVRLHDKISIGAGASYVLSLLELAKVQDFAGVDLLGEAFANPPIGQPNDFGAAAPPAVRELDVLARPVSITGARAHSFSFNAGVAIRPTDRFDLALVYQHGSRLRFSGDFSLDMDDDFFTQDLVSQGLAYPAVVRGEAQIRFRLPKRATVAAGVDVHERVRLDGWVTYAAYQEFDEIDITLRSPDLAQPELGLGPEAPQPLARDWKGSVIVELAPRVVATKTLTVNTLLGYHSPASPDATIDMASPDGHRIVVGAGVGWAITERFSLYGDGMAQVITPRTVTSSDFDLGNGRYNLVLGQVAVHGQLRFGRVASRRRRGEDARDAPTPADAPTRPPAMSDDPVAASPGADAPATSPPPDPAAADPRPTTDPPSAAPDEGAESSDPPQAPPPPPPP